MSRYITSLIFSKIKKVAQHTIYLALLEKKNLHNTLNLSMYVSAYDIQNSAYQIQFFFSIKTFQMSL